MDNRSVPKLRFPEFDNVWELIKIKNKYSLISGQHLGPNDYTLNNISNGYIPYFTGPSDFTNNEEKLTKWTIKDGKKGKKGDILFTVKGSGVGTLMYLRLPFVVMGRQLMAIRSNGCSTKILYHFLSTKKNHFEALASGNMIPGLSRQDILETKLHLPSLPEQQKIAEFLGTIDQKIEQLTKKKSLLEQYKKGVMQKIFKQEIRFKDDDGNEFPEWEEKRAKDVFKNHSNKNHNGELPILAASQEFGMVYRDSIDIKIQSSKSSIKSYKIVEKGDFVISLRSFQGGIEYSSIEGICSPAYIILKPKFTIIDNFFKNYFKKDSFIERLSKTVIGIRDGKQITYENFGGLKLMVPSIPEQQKIADFLTAIDIKINQVNTQLENTKTFKKGLLQQMFV